MIAGTVPTEIREGPAAIRATVDAVGGPAREVAARWRQAGVRRIHVIGNGTSFHSSLASAALYRRHAGPDDPVVVPVTAADFVTYPPALGAGRRDRRHLVVGRVQGRRRRRRASPGCGAVRRDRPRPRVRRSRGVASDVLLSAGGPSTVPVMTKTYSATLAATELLLIELLGAAAGDALRLALRAAADAADAAIAAAEPLVEPLADELARRPPPVRDGRRPRLPGGPRGGAQAQGDGPRPCRGGGGVGDDLGRRHDAGPGCGRDRARAGGPRTGGPRRPRWRTRRTGARATIEVGPDALSPGSALLPLPADAAEDHAPLSAVPPVALLAFALARARGANPDRPDWIERYHSQGLRHILGAGTEVQA